MDRDDLIARLRAIAGDCANTDGWQEAGADIEQALAALESRPAPTEVYLADRFQWAAPGDQQEDAWLVRFCDNDIRDAIYTGPDAEREAWAAWNRHAPGYNMYVFRLARLATDTTPSRDEEGSEAARLMHVIDRDRYAVAIVLNNIKKVLGGYSWLSEAGRGPYAYDDARYQREFGDALEAIDAALVPLSKLAWDKTDCTTDPEKVKAAREAGVERAAALESHAPTEERQVASHVDDELTRSFIDGWNARLDHTDFDLALHFWMRDGAGIPAASLPRAQAFTPSREEEGSVDREAIARIVHENGPVIIDFMGEELAWCAVEGGNWTALIWHDAETQAVEGGGHAQ